jgi:hypothetical protein
MNAREWRTGAGIGLVALAPRLLLAFVTLGSVDIINDIRNTLRLLAGGETVTPYLPGGIDLLLWIGGVAAFRTAIPVALAYKMFAVAADAAIAVLLARPDPKRGLLYALAPVPILICAVHGQWDALFLCPLLLAVLIVDERPLAAGVAIALSIVAKPIALPLIPLFFVWRDRRHAARLAGGLAISAALFLLLLTVTGHPLTLEMLKGIVRYAGGGVQLFGLPYRPPRLWMLASVAVLIVLQERGRLARSESILIFFAVTLGLSGLSAQYLCWVVPFAILCRRFRFHALYTAAAGAFLILYYQSPFVNLPNIENLGTFAFLRPLAFLSPPLPDLGLTRAAVQLLGNWCVPLLCLGFAAWWLWRSKRTEDVSPAGATIAAPLLVLAAIAIAAAWAALQPPVPADAFARRIQQKINAYDVVLYRGPGLINPAEKVWIARSFVDPSRANPLVNASTLGMLWVAAAAVHAFAVSRRSGADGDADHRGPIDARIASRDQ